MSDLCELSLAQQSKGLRDNQCSSAELVEAAIARAERLQPNLNLFISMDQDAARAAARAADDRRARGGALSRIDGIPLAHKDLFNRAGRVATCGSRILADRVANGSATVVTRLEAAGAIWLGALNMSEFAASPTGINIHFGACRNPWNRDHIAAGSSSGSGGAVAARVVPASLGSDTGGSIRLPASANGVVGLKPTYGRISRHGVFPRAFSLDTIGPLARTAEDCALLLAHIAGPDPLDPTTLGSVRPAEDEMRLTGSRSTIVVADGLWTSDIAPDIAASHATALAALEASGMRLVRQSTDWLVDLYELGDTLSKCEAATIHAEWMRTRPQDYSAFVYARTEAGLHLSATRYIEALSLRGIMLQRFLDEVLGEADALFLPMLPVPVPRIAEVDTTNGPDVARVIGTLAKFSRPFSYLGVPAVSVPCGFDRAGLPIGFQLVGKPFMDIQLLGIAHAYQEATDWHQRRPSC